MGMVKCTVCGKDVATGAVSCPNCGNAPGLKGHTCGDCAHFPGHYGDYCSISQGNATDYKTKSETACPGWSKCVYR